METDILSADVESVTMSDILQLSRTWDQPRSTEQLMGFISRREAALSEAIED
jgi:hypothetical protein